MNASELWERTMRRVADAPPEMADCDPWSAMVVLLLDLDARLRAVERPGPVFNVYPGRGGGGRGATQCPCGNAVSGGDEFCPDCVHEASLEVEP